MKKRIFYIMPLVVLTASFFLGSCKKTVIQRTNQYPVLAPNNIDLERRYLETCID